MDTDREIDENQSVHLNDKPSLKIKLSTKNNEKGGQISKAKVVKQAQPSIFLNSDLQEFPQQPTEFKDLDCGLGDTHEGHEQEMENQ